MHARTAFGSIVFACLVACGKDDATGTSTPNTASDAGTGGDASGSSSVASCTAADLAKCDYPERRLKISEQTLTVPGPTPDRELTLVARIPQGAGPFPVVLFSHGGGFDAQGHNQSKEWGAAFASQGYVTVNVGHAPLTKSVGELVCSRAKIPANECSLDAAVDEDSAFVGMIKQLDLVAVLDKLGALSDQSVQRGGPALDLTKITAAGWSAGARGPLLMMGTKHRTTASAPTYENPETRVAAVVALSPAGPGFAGYFDEGSQTSWTNLRGPVFMATGDNDVKPLKPELTPAIRRFGFTAQPGDGTRKLLFSKLPVGVGGHGTYNLGDASSSDERLTRLSRALRSAVLAFVDANVKDDAAAKAWLATENAKILAGDADWEKR